MENPLFSENSNTLNTGHGSPSPSTEYRVLARKYRPTNFDQLIGQEVLVKTLSSAIATGRIAHAFLLTGVRGIGKTTTARIIARALNCANGPTITPCGTCEHCAAIAQDRHIDVMEMDAASRTGVDDIRELIDGVRYRPSSGRYKIYIIDEVHMLSKNAFNALLKTLEEPPESVKFIFATTEVNKLPITVLSRCQRFDLRRLDAAGLAKHLQSIATKESFILDDAAAQLLAQAADGSVRDGLSLLDQAIAGGKERIAGDDIRAMLGLADQSEIYDLLHHILSARTPDALATSQKLYAAGADPLMIAQDLLYGVHAVTRAKIGADSGRLLSDIERSKQQMIADHISIPNLSRAWQLLLKGIGEIQTATNPYIALEMLLVRMCYAADLPPVAQILESVERSPERPPASRAPATASATAPTVTRGVAAEGNLAIAVSPPIDTAAQLSIQSFRDAALLFAEKREMILYHDLYHNSHLVSFAPGKIELRVGDKVRQANFVNQAGKLLTEWTGLRWMVLVSQQSGAPSLAEEDQARQQSMIRAASEMPSVQSVLQSLPGSKIVNVKSLQTASADGQPAKNDTFEEEIL